MTELLLKTKYWQVMNYYIISGSQTVIVELLNEVKLYPMANVNNSHGSTLSPLFIWLKPEKIIHYDIFFPYSFWVCSPQIGWEHIQKVQILEKIVMYTYTCIDNSTQPWVAFLWNKVAIQSSVQPRWHQTYFTRFWILQSLCLM